MAKVTQIKRYLPNNASKSRDETSHVYGSQIIFGCDGSIDISCLSEESGGVSLTHSQESGCFHFIYKKVTYFHFSMNKDQFLMPPLFT